MSPQKLGPDSHSEPGICAISSSDADDIDPYLIADNHPHAFLTAAPWADGFREGLSIRAQYARAHYAQDLDRYIALATELGLVEADEISQYLDNGHFIPGGIEFCMCPVSTYVDYVSKIETLNRAYLSRYQPVHRSDYQDRFLCYCNERLGSYFLMKLLQAMPDQGNDCAGYMHLVTATKAITPGDWRPEPVTAHAQPAQTGRTCVIHVALAHAGTAGLQFALRNYDDGQSISAGNMVAPGYPSNKELLAGALEQHEIDACLDFVDRLGRSDLDPRYHACAWVLNDLRRDMGQHPQRDDIRAKVSSWISAQATSRVIFSSPEWHCAPFALKRLSAWLATLFDDIEIIAYGQPFEDDFAATLAAGLTSVPRAQLRQFWRQPLERMPIDSSSVVATIQKCFAASKVTVVTCHPMALIGNDIVHDFCARTGLDVQKLDAMPDSTCLSAQATAVLAVFAEHTNDDPDSDTVLGNRMALHKVLESFGSHEFLPSKTLVASAAKKHPTSHARTRKTGQPTVSTKQDILDYAEQQIEQLRVHLEKHWSLRLPKHLKTHKDLGLYLDRLMHSDLKSQISPILPQNFDPDRYLRLNKDVAKANVDPAAHFLKHGYYEGRRSG
ncbi:hypothetical protein [Yoonia tamlensis]|uniref:hypothetical protein n=1 Tax=Yoonia tamlensis TaxID=390270 RepID=UPI001041FE16|nr:hypothetical protein [Yoonia tamlensis]